MLIRHPSGVVRQVAVWWSIEFRRNLCTEDVSLEVAIVYMVFKFTTQWNCQGSVYTWRRRNDQGLSPGATQYKEVRKGRNQGRRLRRYSRGRPGECGFQVKKVKLRKTVWGTLLNVLMDQARWGLKTDHWVRHSEQTLIRAVLIEQCRKSQVGGDLYENKRKFVDRVWG